MQQHSTDKATFVPNGMEIRSIKDWKTAKKPHHRNGKEAAKDWARDNGLAIALWNNGHAILYVQDDTSGLLRIKFNG